MGKLNLSHFKKDDNNSEDKMFRGRHNESSGHINTQTNRRFDSLVGENPFRVLAHSNTNSGRRRRRDEGNSRYNDDTNKKTEENLCEEWSQSRTHSRSHTMNGNQHQFRSRRERQNVTSVDINANAHFPALVSVSSDQISTSSQSISDNDVPVQKWNRSGLEVISCPYVPREEPQEKETNGIKPGWIRISNNGIEYGPRSDNYERVLELRRRTEYMLHKEMFAKSRRIRSENIDRYGDNHRNTHVTSISFNQVVIDDGIPSDSDTTDNDNDYSDDDGDLSTAIQYSNNQKGNGDTDSDVSDDDY